MSKEDVIEVEGTVTDVLPNCFFKVTLDGHVVTSTYPEELRTNIYVFCKATGVTRKLAYDLSRGRITWRK